MLFELRVANTLDSWRCEGESLCRWVVSDLLSLEAELVSRVFESLTENRDEGRFEALGQRLKLCKSKYSGIYSPFQ